MKQPKDYLQHLCNNPMHVHHRGARTSQIRARVQQLILQLTAFSTSDSGLLRLRYLDSPYELVVLFWQMYYVHPQLLVFFLRDIFPSTTFKWTLDNNKFWHNGKKRTRKRSFKTGCTLTGFLTFIYSWGFMSFYASAFILYSSSAISLLRKCSVFKAISSFRWQVHGNHLLRI